MGQGVVDELGILVQRCAQELVARDEQDDEFRTGRELRPVGLARERPDVLAKVTGMALEAELSVRVVGGLDGLEVGVQRRLHVDDEFAMIRHAHDHVGADDLVFAGGVHLLLEIAVLDHARQLDEPSQRDLAPAAADLGTPQGLDEILCLLCQRPLAKLHRLELRPDAAIGFAARPLELVDLFLRGCERLAKWLYKLLDGFLAFTQVTPGPLLLRAEVLLREPQERLAVHTQRLVCQLIESGRELRPGRFERDVALALQRLLALDPPFEPDGAAPHDQPHDQHAKQESGRKSGAADLQDLGVDREGCHQDARLTALRTIWASSAVSTAISSAPHRAGSSSAGI